MPQPDTGTPTPRRNLSGRLAGLSPFRLLNERVFFPYRYAQLTKLLGPHLPAGAAVLDVGCSCGRLARRLVDATGCHVVGIDVCIQPQSYVEVRHYDGHTFPFPDGAFDVVMMVDMLHHTKEIEQVLREACRVSRRYLLIKDHYYDNRLDWLGLFFSDWQGNVAYGVPLPYNFLRPAEWAALFRRLELATVFYDTMRLHPLDPCKHLVVKLEKAAGAASGGEAGCRSRF